MQEIQEMQVQSQGWEDSLEEEMTTHARILAWKIPSHQRAWWAMVHEVTKTRTWLSMHAVTLIGQQSLPEIPILSHGFPSDLPLLPHPLPISFSSLQSTSFYQFFNYFLMICVHCLIFWFPVSLNSFLHFHFIPSFPFPTIELILPCDSSLTLAISGLHYNLWTKKSPATPFFINQMNSRTQWKEIYWACSALTPDGSWAASSPPWGVSSVLKHWLRENKIKPPPIPVTLL